MIQAEVSSTRLSGSVYQAVVVRRTNRVILFHCDHMHETGPEALECGRNWVHEENLLRTRKRRLVIRL